MLSFLPSFIKGPLGLLLYIVNTIFWVLPILLLSFCKLLVPITLWRKLCTYLLDACAVAWISINNVNQRLLTGTRIAVQGLEGVVRKEWYLVLANHQSWVDILVLQRIFNHRIPFLKFFLKKELIWVPFLGVAWWALEFPFMRRYSSAFLKKHPHLKGKDIEATRNACRKFRFKPTSIMNFVEGTRYTEQKHEKQASPYQHLLLPRAGGIAFVLNAMGNQLHKLVDVTILYPQQRPSFWDFVCGKVAEIKVDVRVLPIDEHLIGDYQNDKQFQQRFQGWVNQLWQEKDLKLAEMKASQ
ncbi:MULTISPECIES: acyltransferase [Corallincola]|uniref:Acyltransferase n=2 Tax=Corallincola TaxID=1775176 RepID=A0ABY1WLB9_9GAMM|nr:MULTISPECIES: acyltransferase [Corallincola]TAA41032.1 acyltransferase [Corallincola spongiicola]TCI02681.1 acyltransferase [Corallincola luteus]